MIFGSQFLRKIEIFYLFNFFAILKILIAKRQRKSLFNL